MILFLNTIALFGLAFDQPVFTKCKNPTYGFSFETPANWLMRADSRTESSIDICDATTAMKSMNT